MSTLTNGKQLSRKLGSRLVVVLFRLSLFCCAFVASAADERPLQTGARFRAAVNEPLVAKWQNVPLRDVLAHLRLDRGTALLLDRRIDPTARFPIEFVNHSLKDGLARLASEFDGGISLPDNVIYIGPSRACRNLRTLIALRTAELSSVEAGIPKDRQQLWLTPRMVQWDDLDSPLEILGRLQQDWQFQISNPAVTEHDLWGESVLPEVNGIEALSLLLIQFDLTFAWQEAGRAVELTPMPESAQIERPHKVRGKPAEKTLAEWQAAWPEIELRTAGREIVALATIEQHEELDDGPANRIAHQKPEPKPLAQRQFTLQIKDVAAKDLMAELEKSGIVFDYDPQALSAAGVDLNKFVQLNVRKLSAQDFFRTVFDPLGVRCEIEGVTVKLMPK